MVYTHDVPRIGVVRTFRHSRLGPATGLLLIAGATGTGKSVCINSIIASIVYRQGPRDVRLIMVDPKVVELKIFNVLPHMLIPVVTEPKKVPGALKWLLSAMEERYQIFAKAGVRNITGFNHR